MLECIPMPTAWLLCQHLWVPPSLLALSSQVAGSEVCWAEMLFSLSSLYGPLDEDVPVAC